MSDEPDISSEFVKPIRNVPPQVKNVNGGVMEGDTKFHYQIKNGETMLELLDMDFMRSAHEAFFFSLITSFQTHSKLFHINQTKYNIDCSLEKDDNDEVGDFSPTDFSNEMGPISRAAFSSILTSVAYLMAGDPVSIPESSNKARFNVVLSKVLLEMQKLLGDKVDATEIKGITLLTIKKNNIEH